MEFIIFGAIVAVIIWIVNGNKKSINDETVVRTTQTIKFDGGEQTITRTTKIVNHQTNINNPNAPLIIPEHKIVEPTARELELKRQLLEQQERQKVLEYQLRQSMANNALASAAPQQNQEIDINPNDIKVCPKCRQNRRKSSFYRSNKNPDGLTKWCKYCLKKYT